jgi:hypothetical protein
VAEFVLFPTFAACPGCHGPVRGEMVADLTIFVCVRCGSSWHVELGVVYRVEDVPPAWLRPDGALGEDCIDPARPGRSTL